MSYGPLEQTLQSQISGFALHRQHAEDGMSKACGK